MFHRNRLALLIFVVLASVAGAAAQGTALQRVDIARDKVDRMRRSLSTLITVIKEENKSDPAKKDDKDKPDTPLGRLTALDKDTSRLQGDINNLRGKIDRSEKYEASEIDSVETAVAELQVRADKVQLETAKGRAVPDTPVGKDRTVKKKKKFLGLFGGGGNDEYDELIGNVSPGRDRELFIVATREVRKKNYDVGRLLYQTIITTYPDSPYLPMSKLAVGDSFFVEGGSGSLIQAIASYQDWLTFFPTHPLADRVLLKIAESEMRQIGLPDRDPQHARRAEVKLKALLDKYPNSILRDAAVERLRQVQDNLGLHNLYVANYYYNLSVDQKKGGLKGSQSRFREIIEKYPNFCFMDEALYKLAVTYLMEEETDQAARYFQRIISDFPNSDYVEKSKDQLKLIGATVPTANPERVTVAPCAQPGFLANFKNQFFGIYPMTIDKDGVLISNDFDKSKFELIDQIIENQGDILTNQIPQSLTTVIRETTPKEKEKIDQTEPPKKP
jgi:outer membrane assembly lipoprotein YfiO